uniref:alpha-1,2-Mannosidase n=1 Tax=Ursus americanus TaxID=9643 RepID=A0A452QV74_URSAM
MPFRQLVALGLLCALLPLHHGAPGPEGTAPDPAHYRERVKAMFYHAYDSYLENAFPYDELRPLTCDGHDTWGSFSLTLIDALDTLLILGNVSEFQRVVEVLQDNVDFDIDVNASVFETNIRVVGGLLSAHLLSKKAGVEVEAGWPCSGPLLRMAEEAARKLLPAFQTPTGMPYGTVNLLHGVNPGETPVTCTAGIGTFIVEFATLSSLTGDPVFEDVARVALTRLWESRSDIGLVGNHIDVLTGKWVAQDSGIGAGVDSYFEYLVKGAILLQDKKLMAMFLEYNKAIRNYTRFDDWYLWVQMYKGTVSMPVFQSLEAYWPGLQPHWDIDNAMRTSKLLHCMEAVWGLPEFYNIPQGYTVEKREGYPLRRKKGRGPEEGSLVSTHKSSPTPKWVTFLLLDSSTFPPDAFELWDRPSGDFCPFCLSTPFPSSLAQEIVVGVVEGNRRGSKNSNCKEQISHFDSSRLLFLVFLMHAFSQLFFLSFSSSFFPFFFFFFFKRKLRRCYARVTNG